MARVACETATKTCIVMIFGEITTSASINYEQVIRDALKDIGYDPKLARRYLLKKYKPSKKQTS